jgi:hypothetical protein
MTRGTGTLTCHEATAPQSRRSSRSASTATFTTNPIDRVNKRFRGAIHTFCQRQGQIEM